MGKEECVDFLKVEKLGPERNGDFMGPLNSNSNGGGAQTKGGHGISAGQGRRKEERSKNKETQGKEGKEKGTVVEALFF